ncbi:hypothetical protein BDP27DRAFT_1322725 [Rhodocollybia butyracea]|uniref:Uncharacterized protein n=1 Tax=Rhodocollybia butyracea TaxID=206335 RepID=A0A9P5PX76_9AGAR|nr:hypothetical protein BDP27DRAFT_1322725 [Rhodocollybia butyracea]
MLLGQLPEHILDKLVQTSLILNPSLRIAFLSSFGSRIHASSVRVLFSSLDVEDDSCLCDSEEHLRKFPVYPLVANPDRYAHVVRSLTITNPNPENRISETQASRPLDADLISHLLQQCLNLEDFLWTSSLRPPDGICEQLSLFNTRLKRFDHRPSYSRDRRTTLTKWDASSLSLLSTLPVVTLALSGLSQVGAGALVHMLCNLGEDSVLENLNLDLVWLDEKLCDAIAEAGKKIRRLRLSTNGTKLNDKGLTTILEKCDNMEELNLDEVQGRISRSMWTKPTVFPSALRCLRIHISETGPHHSWAIDHLNSLHSFPLEQLTEICIARQSGIPTVQDHTTAVFEGRVNSVVSLKPIPFALSERLRGCKYLKNLHCDFWAFPVSDVKFLLERCPKLESLKICLDESFTKLLGLTSTSAFLSNLHTISVSVNPEHAPGVPPPCLLPNVVPVVVSLPASTAKSTSTQLLDLDQMQTQTCLEKSVGDPSLPLLRDVKRFVRKFPKLELLEWYGSYGRGSWAVKRPATTSKISINVSVDYMTPRLSTEIWNEILQEDQIRDFLDRSCSWLNEPRRGQQWTGEQAELLQPPSVAHSEKDFIDQTNPHRPGKKSRVPSISISTSSSSISDTNMPATPSRSSASPVDVYSPSTSPVHSPVASRSRHPDFSSNSHFAPSPIREHKRFPSESSRSRTVGKTSGGSTPDSPRKSSRGRGRGRSTRTSIEEGRIGRPSAVREETRYLPSKVTKGRGDGNRK